MAQMSRIISRTVVRRRWLRKITSVFTPWLSARRRHTYLARFFLVVFLIFFVTFVTPARNFVGYFFIPQSWRPVSSGKIIQMFYLEEKRFPVETGEGITCDAVETTMKAVDWQWKKIIAEMNQLPAYDDDHFNNIAAHPEVYGTTQEEMQEFKEKYGMYTPAMSAEWQRKLRMTFKIFDFAMRTFNITYFLIEGTMLGSYRHHGIIPWDDDIDLCMNGTDWLRAKQVLHCIPDFDVDTSSYMMYKFFWKQSELLGGSSFLRVPYIDIFFFTEDDEYMWALSRIKKHRIVYKKKDMFPLIYRPFENQMVPVPKSIDTLCTTNYDPTLCVSRDFDHLKDRPLIPVIEWNIVPCNYFKKFYPFVERREVMMHSKQVTVEYKMIGRKVLSNFTVW